MYKDSLYVLSAITVKPLDEARKKGFITAQLSLDLNISWLPVQLQIEGIRLPDCSILSWQDVDRISADPQSCFTITNGQVIKIEAYSKLTDRYYSLYPTELAPTMLISGIPMHRIKDTNPHADTLQKIKATRPLGNILDTTTGLGYTAIEAAKTADHVTTIELDPVVLEICRRNPWSINLFDNPKITQLVGDSFELIQDFASETFSRAIHDPPTISLAGDLYSGEFYRFVFRVLRSNGRLFHYIGDLNSPSGKRVARGATQRLLQVGFKRVVPHPTSFALMAYKN